MDFGFKIIPCADGTEIIDRRQTTDIDDLTPMQMEKYIELDNQLFAMERLERKRKRDDEERKRRENNLLYKIASVCGLL